MSEQLSGYTSTLPQEVLLNPALIMIGTASLGVTRGGATWDPGVETADIQFDGMRSRVKGLQRITKRDGKLSGTIIQIASAAQLANVEPGITTATGGTGVTTILTPKGAGILFVSGDYLTDVRAIWEIGGGNFFSIYMPCALCVKYDMKGADGGEGEIAFEFDAILDMSVGGQKIGNSPYKYELRTALPS